MLDIKFVRQNPDIVKENIRKKFQDHKLVLVDEVIEVIPIVKKKPTNSKKQKDKPNKWTKAITNDIFTGEERYIYENLKTGEIITSGNPNLLETLNAKKEKKVKEVKVKEQVDTSLKYVTFSFNKK